MTESTTAIYWDLGKVLFSNAEISEPEFEPVRDLLGISAEKADEIFSAHWREEVRLGKISEDEYWRYYLEVSNTKPHLATVKTIYRRCIRVNEQLWGMVSQLSHRHDQYVTSNHGKEWMYFLAEKWNFDTYFKGVYCSAWMGVGKPDVEFYRLALERSGKQPDQILYIDDSITNIEAAKRVGIIHGIVYQSNEQVIDEMRGHGVRI